MLAITQSPICNYAPNPLRFRSPSPEYDLAITFKPEGRLSGFETKSKARAEDICRVSSLLKLGGDHAMLGKWLGEATAERHLPLSPASSFYMRSCRRRLLGAIHQHFNDSGFADSHVRVFTIINSRWFIPAGSLSACSAASIKAKFRRYLERALVIDAEGLLFAGLHGSFDGAGYQLHYHGIVAGDKVKALENLRGNFGFVSSKDVYRSLQFEKLNDPPRQISYTLQSWWPYEPQPPEAFALGKRMRLPPDSHAEFLLWMANQNLMDLIIMSGMRTGNGGLESTRPSE